MILKLIETNDTPSDYNSLLKEGDTLFIPDTFNNITGIVRCKKGLPYILDVCKVVKPYGISDEAIKSEDYRYSSIQNNVNLANPVDIQIGYYIERNDVYKKVNILPEQFNYQEIVDLGLKDGDEFEVDITYYADSTPFKSEVERTDYIYKENASHSCWEKISITKPTPVTYTEEEVCDLICDALDDIAGLKLSNEDFKTLWFNLNKKKQPLI
jgi:hypothetical protein